MSYPRISIGQSRAKFNLAASRQNGTPRHIMSLLNTISLRGVCDMPELWRDGAAGMCARVVYARVLVLPSLDIDTYHTTAAAVPSAMPQCHAVS